LRQNRWTQDEKKKKPEGGANWRRQAEKEAAKSRGMAMGLDMDADLSLPPQSRKSVTALVEGGIDMWGSRRVPPLQNMWMVEEEAEDEAVGTKQLVPTEADRMTAPAPPDVPKKPEPEPVDKVLPHPLAPITCRGELFVVLRECPPLAETDGAGSLSLATLD